MKCPHCNTGIHAAFKKYDLGLIGQDRLGDSNTWVVRSQEASKKPLKKPAGQTAEEAKGGTSQ